MGTRTATWGGNAVETRFDTPMSLGITLDNLEYPNGAISLNLSMSANPVRAWVNNGTNARKIDFYLCDSAGNNAIKLFTGISTTSGVYMTDKPNSVTISNTSKTLKGSALYVKSVGVGTGTSDAAYIGTYGPITMTINTDLAGVPVVKGNKIMATDYTQTGASVTAGTVIKISSQFTAGTKAEASTFNSKILGV